MAVAGGLAAANLHYSQPLLPSIAVSLSVPIDKVGFLPATTQVGFAVGILMVLPLADMLERRRLVVVMLLLAAAAMALHAYAPTPSTAFLAALLVGLFGVTPQLMTPFAALLAPKGREGAAVGLVLSGILGGVLVSKILAGLLTVGLGWRSLYWIASAAMMALAGVLALRLPTSRPAVRPRYGDLSAPRCASRPRNPGCAATRFTAPLPSRASWPSGRPMPSSSLRASAMAPGSQVFSALSASRGAWPLPSRAERSTRAASTSSVKGLPC